LGADIHISDQEGNNPIHCCALSESCDQRNKALSKLLEMNCPFDEKNKQGQTPLLIALHSKNRSISEKLIEQGADIHAIDNSKNNSLLLACKAGLMDIALILFKKGVKISPQNSKGETALKIVLLNKKLESRKEFLNLALKDFPFLLHFLSQNEPDQLLPYLLAHPEMLLKEKNGLEFLFLLTTRAPQSKVSRRFVPVAHRFGLFDRS
jgi:ankyrin repeat protein